MLISAYYPIMKSKKPHPDDPISAAEAAQILGRSERLICQSAAKGVIPAKKLGARTWVFRRGDVTALRGKLPGRGRPKQNGE